MKKKYLLESLEFILNKGFCARTIHRAWIEFHKIKQYLKEEDSKLIIDQTMIMLVSSLHFRSNRQCNILWRTK